MEVQELLLEDSHSELYSKARSRMLILGIILECSFSKAHTRTLCSKSCYSNCSYSKTCIRELLLVDMLLEGLILGELILQELQDSMNLEDLIDVEYFPRLEGLSSRANFIENGDLTGMESYWNRCLVLFHRDGKDPRMLRCF